MKVLLFLGMLWVQTAWSQQGQIRLEAGMNLGVYQYRRQHLFPKEYESTYWGCNPSAEIRLSYQSAKGWFWGWRGATEWMSFRIPTRHVLPGSRGAKPFRENYFNMETGLFFGKFFEAKRWSLAPFVGFSVVVADPAQVRGLYKEGGDMVSWRTELYMIRYKIGTEEIFNENFSVESGLIFRYRASQRVSFWGRFNFRYSFRRELISYIMSYTAAHYSTGISETKGLDFIYFSHNGMNVSLGLGYALDCKPPKKRKEKTPGTDDL